LTICPASDEETARKLVQAGQKPFMGCRKCRLKETLKSVSFICANTHSKWAHIHQMTNRTVSVVNHRMPLSVSVMLPCRNEARVLLFEGEGGITLSDFRYVVFYDQPLVKFERLIETYLTFAPKQLKSFVAAEYTVMGLDLYGEPKYVKAIHDHLLDLKPDGTFRLNMDYFNYCTG
jgi:hypothetical protein